MSQPTGSQEGVSKSEDDAPPDDRPGPHRISFSASANAIAPPSIIRVPTSGDPLKSSTSRLSDLSDHEDETDGRGSKFGLDDENGGKSSDLDAVPLSPRAAASDTARDGSGNGAGHQVVLKSTSRSPPPERKITPPSPPPTPTESHPSPVSPLTAGHAQPTSQATPLSSDPPIQREIRLQRKSESSSSDRRESSTTLPPSAIVIPNSGSSSDSSSEGLQIREPSSTSIDHQPEPKSMRKAANEIACQVEEDELLAKTMATQVNEEDLMPAIRGSRGVQQDDQRSENERDDVVSDHYLRPNQSVTQLHGILRKTPSAKWGSSSTVCFDEHGYDRSRSTSLVDSSNNLQGDKLSNDKLAVPPANMPRSESHNSLKSKHRNGSIGKRLAMFHLGHHDDHNDDHHQHNHHHHHHDSSKEPESTPSEAGSVSTVNKHASFAELPLTESEKKESVPFWRKIFQKKKAMSRSFTMDDLKKDLTMDDHLIPEEELFSKLNVNPKTGLSEEEAQMRLARDGKNMLTPPKKVPEIIKLMREFVGGFSPLLEVGALLCFIAYGIQAGTSDDPPGDNLYLGIVLVIVVLITSFFLYAQKAKSERIMEGFAKMLPQSAAVVRNGQTKSIRADDLVMGDIVELHGGDRIPADIRVLEATTLKVDNSSLTGESEAQSRKPESSENPLESKNLVFYTTNCVEGFGKGIVIRRGDATVMGRIAKLTTRIDTTETTIAREMRYFVYLICVFAIVMGIIFIVIALALGYGGFYAVILAIGLVVANVPEGIIITVTVMLTLTAKRMAKKNCLVKNLEAVETLGACSVICSDKTGTLTQNRMTVAHCWVDDQVIETETTTEKLAGQNLPETQTITDLVRVATLCNRAKFKPDQADKPVYARECTGDASETALLKFTEIITGDAMAVRQKNEAVAEIPFNSTTKYQVSVHETEIEGRKRYLLVMKGAPERVWDRCGTVVSQGKEYTKDKTWDTKFNDAYITLGGMGERVLGFCDLLLPEDKFPYPTTFDTENPNFPQENLRFVGLISLIDPPRAAVPDAVGKCRSAGIQVIMVTGDHPVTAKAIARSVGIISEGSETVEDIAHRLNIDVKDVNPRDANAIVIHGGELREMKPEQIDDVLLYHTEIVFARTSPQQKLIIVEACQRAGNVVAVTGDGVNDSPALKKANIGIAMGITGSDVSKQAADMVLLDDNFASIVTGIEEGRLIFDNLKKTICYTMMSNVPEIVPVVLYFLMSIPLGLQTIPMLLICLGTDMVPSISMAHETAEADIMKLPPRNPSERLVSMRLIHCCYLQAGAICSAGAFFCYFVVYGACGFWPRRVIGLRDQWEDESIQDLQDSYGQEWNFHQRMMLQRTVESSYFAGVVVFQWFDLICRKVRRKSIFQKGMRNWFLNFSLVFETAVTAFCIYVPGLNYALSLNTIRFVWWLQMIPFVVFFVVFDEMRRYMIRRYPHGFCEQNFYF